jgi:1-acyl-sn-glycerol-3-phosphate acyltransferase
VTGRSAPHKTGAELGRRLGIGVIHSFWRPRVLGAWKVPPSGPVILACNHSGVLDGPLLFSVSPRPVHFLVKREAFIGPLNPFLHGVGQVPVDRDGTDRAAITTALDVLKSGRVLGIFPEGTRGEGDFAAIRGGLTYFALRSGAPVVPVACFGTTDRGRVLPGLPPLRHRVDIVFGAPFEAGDGSGMRTRKAMDEATTRIQQRLADHLKAARRVTERG